MKYKLLLLCLLCATVFYNTAKANETEPNDTKAQANTLTLNGNNSGAIGTATDVDWWKVVTTGDGKLDVTITVSNNKNLWCEIYDNDGTILLSNGYTAGSLTVSKDGLAAGTYYIKLRPYYPGEMPVYTISNTLTEPDQNNDIEPNDNRAQAKVLPLNNKKTGHVDYYYNNKRDSADWYKVTTTADGRLRLTMSSANTQNVWAYLFDNDGTTLLASGYTSGTAVVVNQDGLAAGTYYIRVNTFYSYEFAPYTLSDSLFSPTEPNDTEPDSTRAQALTLSLNGSVTGHVNYYYNNHKDSVDWYKVTTNADGRLRLKMTSANGKNVWAYLFDNDGKTLLESGYTSGSAVVVNKDGLTAGTYYIRVNTFYPTTEWAPYTLTDSLFVPTEANDTEPDSTRAQALTLPLNGSVTGHVNYYYNNHKDSVDWYKVTTNADGRLRLTMTSANSKNVWAYLFDNDGTTPLASGYTSGSAVVVNLDGLAAGTYYIRVNTFYPTTEWAPYTLSDSLFKPDQANDSEPNDSKAQAITLPLNGSKTGHTNYYYNQKKDTSDWYRLTTNADGMMTISIQSYNNQNVWAYLYDNDGTTLLNSAYTSGSTTYTYDGLKAGTYFIRVKTFYNNEWAPYKLGNTLSTYTYTDDAEPNDHFRQARTMLSDRTTTGHVNFYYNGQSDAVDYHKLNYTGTGNLTLVFNQENRKKYGSADPTWFQVYKDTAAAPIVSNYFYTSSGDINLTGLTQGYYYIKVYTYYNGVGEHFSSYSITNTFTQVNIATIAVAGSDISGGCDSTNNITYKLNRSSAPYRVQLFRFDSAYGDPVIAKGKTITFNNLPAGLYYATVYGDGATGAAFGKSKTLSIEPVPGGLHTTNIKSNQARLNWDSVECADYFTIQYKVHGTNTWSKKKTIGNVNSYILRGLTANTKYDWKVAATDSANGSTTTGAYSDGISFTTTSSLIADINDEEDNSSINTGKKIVLISVIPNPAASYFVIHYNNSVTEKVNAQLFDMNGKAVWSSGLVSSDALNGKQVDVNQLAKGMFYLKIMNEGGVLTGSAKIIVAR